MGTSHSRSTPRQAFLRQNPGSAAVATYEKELVAALITSVQAMLKLKDPIGVDDKVAVPFGTHKSASEF